MRIGIITYYQVPNHGAILQANALKTILENKGHQVFFLTYDRNYNFIKKDYVSKYKISLKSILFYSKYIFKNGLSHFFFNLKKKRLIDSFRNKTLHLNVNFAEFDGDLVIVGSDEVFSVEIGYNECMFGYGLKKGIQVISYAGSFGPSTAEDINKKELTPLISQGLSKFKSISVRDLNSLNICKTIGLNATLVCDPVLLYGYQEEMKYLYGDQQKYVLIYSYDKNMNDKHEVALIKAFAKRNNMKVYSVGGYHRWCDKNINVNPIELLSYFKRASFVITDTFHGTVLSLITNTEFSSKLRGNSNKLYNLLSEYDLTTRITDDFSNLDSIFETHIDFSKVNKKRKKSSAMSMEYLEMALEKYGG